MKRQFVETNRKKKKKRKEKKKKNELGEKPLVRWDVGFGMRKSELRTPRCRCFGRVAPMILWLVLEFRRFIEFQIRRD